MDWDETGLKLERSNGTGLQDLRPFLWASTHWPLHSDTGTGELRYMTATPFYQAEILFMADRVSRGITHHAECVKGLLSGFMFPEAGTFLDLVFPSILDTNSMLIKFVLYVYWTVHWHHQWGRFKKTKKHKRMTWCAPATGDPVKGYQVCRLLRTSWSQSLKRFPLIKITNMKTGNWKQKKAC